MESPQDPCPICGSWPETFQRVPPVYWLEALDPFEALTALRETPQRVADMIAELPAPKVDEKPVEDAWSILNVVTHLRDAQGVLAYRVELLLEQEQPKIESQAVFEWASQGGTQTLEQIFESYQTSREATLEQLMTAPLPAWWRWGVHEEFGRVTIAQQASYFAMHEISHLPQLQNLLGA
jgi:uncharacterized damage-inducible protein DinB